MRWFRRRKKKKRPAAVPQDAAPEKGASGAVEPEPPSAAGAEPETAAAGAEPETAAAGAEPETTAAGAEPETTAAGSEPATAASGAMDEAAPRAAVSIDEAQEMLEEIAESIPKEFYRDLNGGILLLPEEKLSPCAQHNDLWIMGDYSRGGSMGRVIRIYYGSFARVYGHLEPDAFREQLRHTLLHEFTHHVESLAGERGLEHWDEEQMRRYLERVTAP
ncbi:MAG: hypothetical protein ACOX41_09955 [Anaerovoracaceae bacterium]|jgi:predicted Zn-dependent protease with MMP-like domain